MDEFLRQFVGLREWSVRDYLVHAVDIALVAYLNYRVLMLVRGTRAWRILGGIVIFVALLYLSRALGFNTLHWILDKAMLLGPVALVILLLPELRQALEGFGKLGLWPQKIGLSVEEHAEAKTVEELVAACAELAAQRIGALIVIEKGVKMDEIASNGVTLNAQVSAPLLGSIFYEGNPLHDGAVIIRGDAIVAAACRLPLSESQRLDSHMHMRHRAGVGVTEALDCIAIIVSEERGSLSVAMDGRLKVLNSHSDLREILNKELRDTPEPKPLEKPKERRRKKEEPVQR